ncbi:MAG: hypothetical protein B7X67_01270 [Rhizobiales bacterium 39-66-18]|nr:MAG: hypothetical protein B7X67_01270 [Rhizobiales bacterium 39-66-18]
MRALRHFIVLLLLVAYGTSAMTHVAYTAGDPRPVAEEAIWLTFVADDVDAHEAMSGTPACHCVHAAIPAFSQPMRFLKIGDEWVPTVPSFKIAHPDIPTPPPRPIGNEAKDQTSIPTFEVSHVSLCSDRIHRASHPVECTG